MKSNPLSLIGTILLVFFCTYINGQNIGATASAVWITDCNQSNFFNTSGSSPDLIGPSGNTFNNSSLGVHTQNSGTLILRGAQVRTFKNPASSNVCGAKMYYRIYLQSATPGAFTQVDLPFLEDCSGGTFPSGGTCNAGDQKWQQLSPTLVNLTAFTPGSYVLEIYYEVSGSNTSTTGCTDLVTLNNSGNNYKATFFIQSPNLTSTNPSSCFGNGGSITIGGLSPGASYLLSYTDDGVNVGPNVFVANSSGQVTIPGLNKGFYSNFVLQINGCSTNLFTGIILSDPIYVPIFSPIPPICAGATAPVLPATSINGLAGTWNPATVDNQNSGTYMFTPNSNQCGIPVTITVTVIPNVTPTFGFGTSLVICENGTVPVLPNASTNGITGSWSPSVVDNQNSGTYTFTPTAGQCAVPTTFTVTVNPNITPTFDFGTSLTVCEGDGVPSLPGVSTNGITGSWSPAAVSNLSSGTYTFTPDPGQCAVTATLDVTVNPVLTPVFSFGSSLSVCAGESVPALPTTSTNGINGTWNPSVVNDQASGTYTFTPTAGQCATTATYTVTVNPNIPPVFSFGTSLVICAGGSVPGLPGSSTNGITGTWNPAVVDDQNSATYTFTPTAGQCATIATFTVTVNPNITPIFDFGTSLSICAGGTAPVLPAASNNGISGTWSPSAVSNQNSGTYTFTPDAGQCAVSTTLTVTIDPNITPSFGFGNSLSVCAGGTVPGLPTTSVNGINGKWNPSTVNNLTSGTYTFTPAAGQCATTTTFTVTVNPNIPPVFSFGSSLSVCAGGTVPPLPATSTNGISGTWNPATVDDQNSGTYTFTPDAGQCATNTSFTVTVNPNITPTFSFGTSISICEGDAPPSLPVTSDNGISGTWSPSTISNLSSGTYTFTPGAGQCALSTTLTVTVNSVIVPVFSFGPSLSVCIGSSVPVLPSVSDNLIAGTWSPSTVSNQNSGAYVFTPSVSGPCVRTYTFTVTVNQPVTPTFSFGAFQSVCIGSPAPGLPLTSLQSINGTWSPAIIDNQNSDVYTFTPDAGQCANIATLTYEVNPVPSITAITDTTVYDGDVLPLFNFTSTAGSVINWTNDNPSIGLVASGSENIPSFTAINKGNTPAIANVAATPRINGCFGSAQSRMIKVIPLDKDIFVPNAFSPNGDGKNDLLYVYGNYIDKVDMRIFNQWGQQIATISNKSQGWDGRHKGSPQPVGVYVYVLKAVLEDGTIVNLKGSVTLVR